MSYPYEMSTSIAGTSGAVPSSSAQQVMPVSPSKRSASGKRNSTRIIRTFEEVEKTIFQEEWYEELECGICSNVLGAPQALVPCGHTFCGPCAWQWIRTNKNHTCPHCRMEVTEATPFVPNIVVEQIIERKLRAIADGEQKVDLMLERKEKSEAWRVLQDTLPPSKQTKKGRGPIDELLSSIFDPAAAGTHHQRRASRHLMELGAPIAHGANRTGTGGRPSVLSQNGGPSLGDLRRLDAEEEAVRLMIAFRQRVRENRAETAFRTHQGLGPAAFVDPVANPDHRSARPEASRSASTNDIGRFGNPAGPLPNRFAPAQASNSSHGRSNLAGAEASQTAGGSSRPRPSRLTSQALLSRQARGRGGTRDAPLVVASDSEDD